MGTAYGIYPCSALVTTNWRETFSGRMLIFFLGGAGEGRGAPGRVLLRGFRRTTRVPNSPLYVYIIYCAVVFFAAHAFRPREGGPRSSIALGRHFCCSTSTARRPSPRIEDGEGAAAPRSPRTPQSSGYVVYAHAVYVVICYMSLTCICLCLVLAASCICICPLYVVICYMSLICYMSVICLV
jgi:hypothetical protein